MGNYSWHNLEAGFVLNQLISSFQDLQGRSFFPSLLFLAGVLVFILLLLFARWLYLFIHSLTEESVVLEITPPAFTDKSAYTTGQLFSVIHGLRRYRTIWEKILGVKPKFSFEIVSSKEQGIRYLVKTSPKYAANFKRTILSYMSQVRVKETEDYLSQSKKIDHVRVLEFKLSRHFAFPLNKQDTLGEHDPVAYITGMMTKLNPDELVSLQIVLSPTVTFDARKIKYMILRNENVLSYLDNKSSLASFNAIAGGIVKVLGKVGQEVQWAISELLNPASRPMYLQNSQNYLQNQQVYEQVKPARTITMFEQKMVESIKEKVDQPLFETSVRLMLQLKDKNEEEQRVAGFISSLESFAVPGYQSFSKTSLVSDVIGYKFRLIAFRKRLLSFLTNSGTSLLSSSEIAELYHFPFSRVTQTENIVKAYSKELPAPLSLKQEKKLEVVFGKNTYGGITTNIGLTEEQRQTHMYILGRTGSGKTTLMYSMAKRDIEEGRGTGFIDPHGDVSEDLLAAIPEERKDDLIYVNPWDIKFPVGINVMELSDGLDGDELELEKEVVCEGVVSLFKKVFSKDENANAHRIEHILRNTIYTAFYVPDRTLFTINKLLTNATFRKKVLARVDDEDLKDFWKGEFGKAGDYQVVKMTQGVTAKVGRFLRSPTARRMLEQSKSTINFDEVLDGKILICNLSQGKLGEDTTKLIGTTILTKIQQAALKRSRVEQSSRKPFYLYIDEFQNFATLSFIKIVSEGRKYGLHLIMAEQSTSQVHDQTIINQILANVTTVVVFRSGNYIDEELMLNQLSPYLQKGDIPNLPRYHFYIKISALESEEPFSGETIYIPVAKDQEHMEDLIAASQKNWAREYVKPVKTLPKEDEPTSEINSKENEERSDKNTGLPQPRRL